MNYTKKPTLLMKIRTERKSTFLSAALLALLFLAAAPGAQAASLTWDTTIAADSTITDGTGNWANGAGNWNNGSTSVGINWNNSNPDSATFSQSGVTLAAAYTVTLTSGITVGGLSFPYSGNTSIYTLAGSQTLTFSGTPNVNVNSTAVISTLISGDFNKTGAGFLKYDGNNSSYAGNIGVSAGTLQVGNAGTGGDLGTGTITLSGSGGFLVRKTGGLTLNNTIAGSTSGSVSFQPVSSGSANTFTIAKANTYTAASALTPSGSTSRFGILKLGIANGLPTTTDLTIGNATSSVMTFDLAGFNQTLNSLATASGGTTANSIVTSSSGTPTLTISGASPSSTTYAGLLSGALALFKDNTGTLTLSGANTYSGGTTNNGGILVAGNNSALGSGSLVLTNAATRLVLSDGVTIANNIAIGPGTSSGAAARGIVENSSSGTATLSGGSINILSTPASGGHFAAASTGTLAIYDSITSAVTVSWRTGNGIFGGGGTYSGLSLQAGTISLGANNGISTSATLSMGVNGNATLDLAGYNQTLAGVSKSGNTVTIANSSTTSDSVLTTTGTSSFAGTIQDVTGSGTRKVALNVNGGSLTLTGANTYTGGTTNLTGTLLINGSITSSVTNLSGGIFGGVGTATGNLSFGSGAFALFTNGATLTINGNLILNNNTVKLNLSNNVPAGTYTLATVSGTVTGSFASTPTISSGSIANGSTPAISISGGNVLLTVSKVNPSATLSVANSPQTYNGSAQSALVTISSSSVSGTVSNVKYNGASTVPTATGTNIITADFVPNDTVNYNTLAGVSAGNFVISRATTSVGAISSENPSGYKDAVTYTATLPADATGNVVFSSTNGAFSTNAVSSGSGSSLSIPNLPRGTNVITVAYLGDGNYFGSTNTLNQIITNHPPVASVMTVTRTGGLGLIIALSDMATNWTDNPDGDHVDLTGVTMQSTNGVNLFALNWITNLDGTIVTTNNYAFIGYTNSPNVNDQISYSISDGFGGTNTGYVNIVIQSSVTGTNSITGHDFSNPYSNTVTAYGIPYFFYVLERATNLTSPVWVDVQTNQANPTNGIIKAADTFWDLGGVKPNPSAFYQLKWQP